MNCIKSKQATKNSGSGSLADAKLLIVSKRMLCADFIFF